MDKVRRQSRISSSPLLVGAVTTVIAIVGVFFSYNANTGLPFVPTYRVGVDLPSGSSLVQGNEVRIAGVRVGVVDSVNAEQLDDGVTIAKLQLKLDKSIQPIPEDSTVTVRQRSALGLKYLLLTPGDSSQGLPAGATLPITQATPEPVDQDQFFNMFQPEVRRAIQINLAEYGGAFAVRGADINEILGKLPPLLKVAKPVTRNLSSKKTDLTGFIQGLAQAAAEVAPVADQQAEMFVNLDTTFTALAVVARPFMQDAITESVKTQLVVQEEAPRIRPFLYASAKFARTLQPGATALAKAAPVINESRRLGIPVLRSTPQLYNQLAPTSRSLRQFGESAQVNAGLDSLIETNQILEPLFSFLGPAQNVCNYLALLLRNVAEVSSAGNSAGKWVRAISVLPPVGENAEGGPAAAPANGGAASPGYPVNIGNFLHSNPYPYTASPGQPRICAAGNEIYTEGVQVIGNGDAQNTIITNDQSEQQLNWNLNP
ncbi:MAG: MlaD family protein [Solirubrobacterales bacterium]